MKFLVCQEPDVFGVFRPVFADRVCDGRKDQGSTYALSLFEVQGKADNSWSQFRTVKISRMKCLVGWPNVSRSKNQVTVDVVQKFYFLMFTGICIIIICVCQQQNNKSDKQGLFNCWLLQWSRSLSMWLTRRVHFLLGWSIQSWVIWLGCPN